MEKQPEPTTEELIAFAQSRQYIPGLRWNSQTMHFWKTPGRTVCNQICNRGRGKVWRDSPLCVKCAKQLRKEYLAAQPQKEPVHNG